MSDERKKNGENTCIYFIIIFVLIFCHIPCTQQLIEQCDTLRSRLVAIAIKTTVKILLHSRLDVA